jgi:hypothetical protein
MTKPLLRPFINKFTGEVKTLSRKDGKQLSKDWSMGKMTKNQDGNKVFRFELSADVTGKDGKVHRGTAIVDLTPHNGAVDLEGKDGNRDTK